jgi:hypothetical protein
MRLSQCLAAVSAIVLLAVLGPREPALAQDAAKGSLLLAEARKAIGGDDKLAAVKRLQVSGTFLRSTGPDQIIDGDFDVFIELPDKYRRNEITGFAGTNVERSEILNGDQVSDQSSGGLTAGGFPGGGFGRGGRGGGDRGGGGGFRGGLGGGRNQGQNTGTAQQDAGAVDDRMKDQLRRVRQAELARLALVWLLSIDGPAAWIGTAQAPEGTADVLEVRPANGVPTRLFLDPATHVPLMISWSGQPSRGGDIRRRGAPAPSAPTPAQGQATLELHMGNYKTVNGLKLPHLITRGTEGTTQEELKIKSFKINPNFKADSFTQ